MPEIGDIVYRFDENHRVYERDPATGRAHGGPIYREYFKGYVIVGTEKRSWLISRLGIAGHIKVAKGAVITAQEMDDRCWLNDHRMKVARLVENCTDPALLNAVGALVGYPPSLEPS